MIFEESPKTGKYYMLRSEKLTSMYFSLMPSKRPSNFIKGLNMGCRLCRFNTKYANEWAVFITDVNKFMLGIMKYEL